MKPLSLTITTCTLQVFTACEAAKQSNKVACPCAADWKYRGEDYSFCADPNNGGFLWCATQTDEVGSSSILFQTLSLNLSQNNLRTRDRMVTT